MMECTRYRQAIMAQPHDPDPALAEHRESCADCKLFTDRLLRFETRLERALGVAIPAISDRVVLLTPKSSQPARGLRGARSGWLAMAASVLVAAVVAGGLWLGIPGSSLAADVVAHMREEPQAWRRTGAPVPDAALQEVLRDSRVRVADSAGIVSYASSCGFRGHRVPHLVIQTESGPVTVMVLVHESVAKSVQFDEQGYRGVIVPVPGHGSLAVLTQGAATDPEHIAHRVLDSIVWTG
jgi:hypothetical protein